MSVLWTARGRRFAIAAVVLCTGAILLKLGGTDLRREAAHLYKNAIAPLSSSPSLANVAAVKPQLPTAIDTNAEPPADALATADAERFRRWLHASQHPPRADCARRVLLVQKTRSEGFFSEVHVMAQALLLAAANGYGTLLWPNR